MTTIEERQIELEEKMLQLGADSYNSAVNTAIDKAQEGSTKYGVALISHHVDAVAAAITTAINAADTGKPGKRHVSINYLKQMDPKIAALLSLRLIIDGISRRRMVQTVAIQIASRVEDQVRYQGYDSGETKGLFRSVKNSLKGSTSYRHQRTVMNGAFNRLGLGADAWPERDRLQVGMKLISIVVEVTDLIQLVKVAKRKNRTSIYLAPTQKLTDWINQKNSRCELLTPLLLPMITTPKDWTTPFDGGYFLENGANMSIVKTRSRGYLEELDGRRDDMSVVYDTVNALQRTAWRINSRVLSVMQDVWDNSRAIAAIPSKENVVDVPCPACGAPLALKSKKGGTERANHACFDTDPHAHKKWKHRAATQYEANHRLLSKRLSFDRTLWVAEMFKDEDSIFMVYQLDFRGRIYAVPQLNPQGDDATKSLLGFAKGAPIGDGTGPGWLAIQGANVFGEDKISLEDRITFIEENSERIVAIAAEPMSDLWWADADKPWQFLAFCFEWAGYKAEGASFVSHLPVALDGSCSGIQHFSAMLRDQRGGECVNLVPSEKPSDIYQQVADIVIERMTSDLTVDGPQSAMARALLALGVSRKSVKRQVMVLPYGGTPHSCREYTDQWMREAALSKGTFPYADIEGESIVVHDTKEWFAVAKYMSDIVWSSIGEVVVAARSTMDWLQQCAKVVAAEELPITWVTPAGLPIVQSYKDTKARRVDTTFGDIRIQLSLSSEEEKLDKGRMKASVSPNFVHSMDGAHLMLSVVTAQENGITDFHMIHDSFGTHAANAELFGACLRHAFVEMYEENDVLTQFRDSILSMLPVERHDEVPPVPDTGNLNLKQVMESDFFFA